MRGDERVLLGTPDGIVRAIQDAVQAIGAILDYAFEAAAVLRGLNLLRVLGTDGGEVVRIDQAALEEIHFAVEFHRVHAKQAGVEAKFWEHDAGKCAVVAHVVNREDDRQTGERGIAFVLRAEKHGNERDLPVVAMDDVGLPAALREFHDGAGEFAEARGVIGIVFAAYTVKLLAIEVFRIVHEEITDAIFRAASGDRGETQALAKTDGETGEKNGRGWIAAIAREDDADLMTERYEGFGQRLDYVGEAARLGVGQPFGCGEENFHRSSGGMLKVLKRVAGVKGGRRNTGIGGAALLRCAIIHVSSRDGGS